MGRLYNTLQEDSVVERQRSPDAERNEAASAMRDESSDFDNDPIYFSLEMEHHFADVQSGLLRHLGCHRDD